VILTPSPSGCASKVDTPAPYHDADVTIRLSADECRDFEGAITREWLATNGLGGYASGTVAGPNTRRYHGLLMAALHPPVQRVLLLAALDESVDGEPLSAHEYWDGTVAPAGFRSLESVCLDGMLPCFRWRINGRLVERRIWMDDRQNRTVISYRLLQGPPGRLDVRPLFAHRPADLQRHGRATARPDRIVRGWRLDLDGLTSYFETDPIGNVSGRPDWYVRVLHRAERERGLDSEEDLFTPGFVELPLNRGRPAVIIAGTEPLPQDWSPAASLATARRVQRQPIEHLGPMATPIARQLALAASQFRVARISQHPTASEGMQRTIVAGYPWFADWGRDTMIAFRGLTLAAGYPDEARRILRTFISHLDEGMLPNAFHDPGERTEFNTIDATLWLFQALHHYLTQTDDWPFVRDQIGALEEVVRWHVAGTRYDIHMDPADGLLSASPPGYGLTWMDAKDGDWVVTARHGKPVEIAALWYNALRLLHDWKTRNAPTAMPYAAMAEQARQSAQARFWYPGGGYLYDVIDGPGGDDASLRPNQLMALGLVYPLIDGPPAKTALDVVTAKLLTPLGLRTLSPDDPRYQSRFGGDHRARDAAYQMGIVWPWLLGPYLDAHRRIYKDATIATRILAPFEDHFREAGLGTVSEIFEAEPPHRPVGAVSQAWSVGELLWHAARGSR
jgi:predicted glycogen debranching enzyme